MSDQDQGGPDGWTTPAGWGGPAQPPPAVAPGQQQYGQQQYGQRQYAPLAPELKPGVVPLRPLGLGEVLDGAVGVLRRYPRPALGLSAAIAVVSVLITTLVSATLLRPLLELDQTAVASGSTEALTEALGGAAAGGAVSVVLGLLSGAILTGVLTAVVGKAVLGQPMSLGEAWTAVRPALGRLIALSLLTGAIVGGVLTAASLLAALLSVVGSVGVFLGVLIVLGAIGVAAWLYVRLSLAPCALMLEGTSIVTSLRRSTVLVKGDWWRVFGILLLVQLIAGFVGLVIQGPFEAFGAGSPGAVFDPDRDVLSARALVLSGIGSILTTTVLSPFTAGARALLYVDRRMRAEGLDVALAAAAAGARA